MTTIPTAGRTGATYHLHERVHDSLVIVTRGERTERGDRTQLWDRRPLRKPARCACCGRGMASGDLAFGPVNNAALFRSERLCTVTCIPPAGDRAPSQPNEP